MDIGEENNLVESMPEKAEQLAAELDQWLVGMDAYIPGPDPGYDPTRPFGTR